MQQNLNNTGDNFKIGDRFVHRFGDRESFGVVFRRSEDKETLRVRFDGVNYEKDDYDDYDVVLLKFVEFIEDSDEYV